MRYILRRLGFYIVAFWAALTINFFLPRLLPGDPPIVELVNRASESLDPIAAPRLERLDLMVGNVAVPLEQVGGHVERRPRHFDQPRLVLRKALAEQRARLGRPQARAEPGSVRKRRRGGSGVLGHGNWGATSPILAGCLGRAAGHITR